MALEHIPDHSDRAVGRLIEEYRGSISVTGLVRLAAAGPQSVEDTLWTEFMGTVGSATGAQLDVYGKIVGQAREGRPDDLFRSWIMARVQVNRSGGTGPNLIGIFSAVCPGSIVTLVEQYPAAFALRISGGPVLNASELANLLRIARAAGVHGVLETTNAAPAGTFTFDVGPGLDVGTLADAYA